MAEPTDDPLRETGEAISGALRTAAVGAGEIVRMRFMRQTNEDRQAAAADQATARELTRRVQTDRAERTTAASLYRATHSKAWWQHARADDVAKAWDAATAFAEVDPLARVALTDLSRGLHEHPHLKATLLRDHPESQAAQSFAPATAPAAGTAGVVLAVAADLEADLDPGAQSDQHPEPTPTPEEEAWYESQHQQEEELAERGEDLSPEAEAAADAQDSDAWRRSEAERVNGALNLAGADPTRESAEYTEAAGVGQLVGDDFPPADVLAQGWALAAPNASTPGPDTAGITHTGSGSSGPEHQDAAGVGQLVGHDFPDGVANCLPRKDRAGAMRSPHSQAQSGLPQGLHLPAASAGVEL